MGQGKSRLRRSQRIAVIMRLLLERPGRLIPLGHFAEMLGAAKSTISEDISLIRETLVQQGLGTISSVTGAAGGVVYKPRWSAERVEELLAGLSARLNDPGRILPGGYIYMTDLAFDPVLSRRVGDIFATIFGHINCDAVVTVETRGIPIALMTARSLGKPMVTCRRESRPLEGTAISISYVSGSERRLQSMSLARRALTPGSRVLFIDDYLKGGGTARGVETLMAEFGAEIVGTGVLVATGEPEAKLVNDYIPLVVLDNVDADRGQIVTRPNGALVEYVRKLAAQ